MSRTETNDVYYIERVLKSNKTAHSQTAFYIIISWRRRSSSRFTSNQQQEDHLIFDFYLFLYRQHEMGRWKMCQTHSITCIFPSSMYTQQLSI